MPGSGGEIIYTQEASVDEELSVENLGTYCQQRFYQFCWYIAALLESWQFRC